MTVSRGAALLALFAALAVAAPSHGQTPPAPPGATAATAPASPPAPARTPPAAPRPLLPPPDIVPALRLAAPPLDKPAVPLPALALPASPAPFPQLPPPAVASDLGPPADAADAITARAGVQSPRQRVRSGFRAARVRPRPVPEGRARARPRRVPGRDEQGRRPAGDSRGPLLGGGDHAAAGPARQRGHLSRDGGP
jgi:hypothetical protein